MPGKSTTAPCARGPILHASLASAIAVATLVCGLLTGCVGADEDSGAPASESAGASSSSADAGSVPAEAPAEPLETAAAGDDEPFCATAPVWDVVAPMWVNVDTADLAVVQSQVRNLHGAVAAVNPPADIADDWAVMVNAFDTLYEVLDHVIPPPDEEIEDYMSGVDAIKQAQENITAYTKEHCLGE